MADIGIITFQLGGMNFCIYADRILEIVRYTEVRKIPRPLPYVIGLIGLRKHIVVVVDFRKRLGLSPISLSKDTVMIVANLSSGMTGILVDAISDFKRIPEEMILPPIPIAGFPEQLLNGVFAEKGDITLIPNLNKIFSSYFNIRIVPIRPSEKIAFQYRFTPGSLTRTLEDNLLNQQYLDYDVVRKLPQSLCLSSILVHKMTSYYSDFQPRKSPIKRKEQRWLSSQKLRAGDEKYFSLSQQLLPQQQQGIREEKPGKRGQDSRKDIIEALIPDSSAPLPKLLEDMLHTLESPHIPLTIDDWRSLVGIFTQQSTINKVSPIRITKYFRYYTQVSSTKRAVSESDFEILRLPLQISSEQALEKRLQELLTKNRPAKGEPPYSYLLRTLQTLHNGRYELTRKHLEKICAYYHISPVKIAKLSSFFPEYSFILQTKAKPPHQDAKEDGSRRRKPKTAREDVLSEPQLPNLTPHLASVSECLGYLAKENKLSEDQYIRYVASRMRVPTCRLSKLRSYYRWN
jgi:purine-binding chemotaxis protein CheW